MFSSWNVLGLVGVSWYCVQGLHSSSARIRGYYLAFECHSNQAHQLEIVLKKVFWELFLVLNYVFYANALDVCDVDHLSAQREHHSLKFAQPLPQCNRASKLLPPCRGKYMLVVIKMKTKTHALKTNKQTNKQKQNKTQQNKNKTKTKQSKTKQNKTKQKRPV